MRLHRNIPSGRAWFEEKSIFVGWPFRIKQDLKSSFTQEYFELETHVFVTSIQSNLEPSTANIKDVIKVLETIKSSILSICKV